MTSVEQFLRLVATATGRKSPHQLILDHGREYAWGGPKLPPGVRLGEKGACFMNAYQLADAHPDKYTYVEGVASAIIPVDHAWCVTADGVVVDPTWRFKKGDAVPEYYGIPISLKYAWRIMVKTRVYGVLWNYVGGFPMMTDKPEEWRA